MNVVKNAAGQIASGIATAIKTEAATAVEGAQEQVVGSPQTAETPSQEQTDEQAYREELAAKEKQDLATLRSKLAALSGEMSHARGARQQQEQAYHERVDEQFAVSNTPSPDAPEQQAKVNKQEEMISKKRGAAKKEMGKQKG